MPKSSLQGIAGYVHLFSISNTLTLRLCHFTMLCCCRSRIQPAGTPGLQGPQLYREAQKGNGGQARYC
jgi:hypothetical protein